MKGALIGLDIYNPLASVVVFQYNPEKLTRSLTGQFTGGRRPEGAGAAADSSTPQPLRISGPPRESITLDVAIDATDQLEKGDALATSTGIYPALSSLENMLYPKTALVFANQVLARLGVISVQNPEAPLTLLIWGIKRILPVRITQFSITEEEYDPRLNPIRAHVQLGLTVQNYEDTGLLSAGGGIFMAHQIIKEVLATVNGIGTIANLGSTGFSL